MASFNTAPRSALYLFIMLVICAFAVLAPAQSNSNGSISGRLVDSQNGEALVGANVYLENMTLGAATDLEGNYLIIKVPAGIYTLIVSSVGYTETKIINVQVAEGENTSLDVAVSPEIMTSETITVEAKVLKNTDASLLKTREKSNSISDAVSAESMSQAGSDNAADAMKQLTGASLVDGKYVYVRGLGDRYISTQLNGSEIPSTDPYRRSGSIDMIPSNLIDNIQTIKSFTPDKPGDFSGGVVDISTKDFPEKLNFSLSLSSTYNSQSTFNNDGLGYGGGSKDWLGMDDGTRDIPAMLEDENVYIPTTGEASADPQKAKLLTDMTNSFTKEFGPSQWTPPLNHSFAASIGNQINLFGRPLGYLASLSYSHNNSSYQNAVYQRWVLGSSSVIAPTYDFRDSQTTDEVLWGSLLKMSYQIMPNHVVSFNGMYNQNGESLARSLQGKYPYDSAENDVYRTRVLSYTERTLKSAQIEGTHFFNNFFDVKLNWKASLGNTSENEPDRRYFTDKYRQLDGQRQYFIKPDVSPSRYYRDLGEDRQDFTADLNIPFKQWLGYSSNFKLGILSATKNRDYSERVFNFYLNQFGLGEYAYDGDPNNLLSSQNIGVIDTNVVTIRGVTYSTPVWGIAVTEKTLPNNIYHAEQSISASYAMLELPLINALKFVGGARYESTTMQVSNGNLQSGFETHDWLPSANLIYSFTNNMNVRLAYSKTLARPTFREMSEFVTEDFIIGEIFIGNPDLKRTLIKNYDFRWEWFSRPGEIYAISLFYKDFDQPIERVYNASGENSWTNIDEARVYGMELEFRKKLDLIHKSLSNFLVGGNLSLINSEHRITDAEWFFIEQYRPDADRIRPFQGQSPYLINASLIYDNPQLGLISSIYYNIFGERLDRVSYAATPDVYEKPASILNFSVKWSFSRRIDLKFAANNLLNQSYTKYHSFKGKEYIYSQYKKGTSFSVGLGYNL